MMNSEDRGVAEVIISSVFNNDDSDSSDAEYVDTKSTAMQSS